MKTISVILCIAAFINSSNLVAQKKGDTLFGGSLHISQSKEVDYDYDYDTYLANRNTFSMGLVLGSMVSDKVAFGFGLGYTKVESYELFTIMPFLRFHKTITENFNFITEPSIGIAFTEDRKAYHAGINFGLLYFLNEHWSLDCNIGGINYDQIGESSEYKLTIDYDIFSPKIGLLYYF